MRNDGGPKSDGKEKYTKNGARCEEEELHLRNVLFIYIGLLLDCIHFLHRSNLWTKQPLETDPAPSFDQIVAIEAIFPRIPHTWIDLNALPHRNVL